MPSSVAVRNLTHGQLYIDDGTTPTANTLQVPAEEGNLEFVVTRAANVLYNRGTLIGFTPGIPEPMSVTFTLKFQEWRGQTTTGADPSPADALLQQGNASSWVSTIGCGPYTVDLRFQIEDPCAGTAQAGQTETLVFPDFHPDEIRVSEGEEFNTIQVSGRSLAFQPTATRDAFSGSA